MKTSSSDFLIFLANPIVAVFFEVERKVGSARFDDPPIEHDVDEVRFDVIQQALVMGDDKHAKVRTGEGVDPLRNNPQRVDVETRISLV